jgi:predicted lipid-binding transport protein (Tim44 family)
MNGQFDLITLISLVVAAVAILKLRNVLGQRTDEDDARVERLKTREREARAAAPDGQSADVITMPRRDRDDAEPVKPKDEAEDAAARMRAYPALDASVTEGLLEIAAVDKAFDPESFLQGASRAYEMIVSAFAEGDKNQLKDLLSREVYDGFVSAINERVARGETIDQQFVGLKKSDILEAELKSGVAQLTVRFISELITATRDRGGAIIAGDPQKIKDVTDIWTFSRDVSSAKALANLNWRLIATQAPN